MTRNQIFILENVTKQLALGNYPDPIYHMVIHTLRSFGDPLDEFAEAEKYLSRVIKDSEFRQEEWDKYQKTNPVKNKMIKVRGMR